MFGQLKQLQELRKQADQIKTALAAETIEGRGANGLVKIIMDGNQEVKQVEIDDQLLADKEKLAQGLKEATNDGIKKVQQVMAKKMSQLSGLGLPGM